MRLSSFEWLGAPSGDARRDDSRTHAERLSSFDITLNFTARSNSIIMEPVATEDGWLTTPDGEKLYTKTWKAPPDALKARMVAIHGFSDHCDFYGILFPTLAQRGITVYGFDQRGWGRSVHEPAQKGRTGPTKQVLADITTFIKSLPEEGSHVPTFLFGHSMGGAEVIHYAASGPQEVVSGIRGFLLESPFIDLHPSGRPWKSTVVLGRLVGRLLPNMHMLQALDPAKLSRDENVGKTWKADPLCHDTGTLQGLAGMLDRAEEIRHGKVVLKDGIGDGGKTRLWVGHGTADQICDCEATRKWYEGLQIADKEAKLYEGHFHKLHDEPGQDRVQFANDVSSWILARCNSEDRAAATTEARSKL